MMCASQMNVEAVLHMPIVDGIECLQWHNLANSSICY